jgi:hypothetical protein
MTPSLLTYQHVWTYKNSDGWQYEYHCTWSDGDRTVEHTLPWGRMDGAKEFPSTSWREIRAKEAARVKFQMEAGADVLCAAIEKTTENR